MELRGSDFEAALAFVGEIVDAPDVPTFADRVADAVRKLVPADVGAYSEVRPRHVSTVVAPDCARFDGDTEVLAALQHENPLIVHALNTGDLSAHRISEFLTTSQWHRRELCRTLYEPLEAAGDQLALSLRGPDALIGITINLRRGLFTDRDCAVLNLVAPHIAAAYANAQARERLRARVVALEAKLAAWDARPLIADRDRQSGAAHLTSRETQVLGLAAEGLTNRDIAAQLDITPRTVKKHLASCYAKFGVHTRTAAAMRLVGGPQVGADASS